MFSNKIKLVLLIILISEFIYPQVNQKWVNRYNGIQDGRDGSNSIICDSNGNIYVAGYTQKNGYQFCTIKYNSFGNRLWERTYTGSDHFADLDCQAVSIKLDSYNNVIVGGYCNMVNGGFDFYIIKYKNNGDTLWVRQYNSPENGHDEILDLTIDENNFIYVTGVKDINGVSDYCTIKYNPNGNIIWIRTYNGLSNSQDEATSIKVDDKLNVYITGSSRDSNYQVYFTTIKYDSSGNVLWKNKYRSGAFDEKKVMVDKNYNVIVTGTCYNPWNGFCAIKYDSSGNQKFASVYGTDYIAHNGAIDKLGNIYVIGEYWENYNSNWGFCSVKFDSSGNYEWERKKFDVNGHSTAGALGIALDSNNNIFVTGYLHSDYYTVKYNTGGTKIWDIIYNGTSSDIDKATSIAIDKFNDIVVTGYSSGTGAYHNYDIVTIKYSESSNIIKNINFIPNVFSLYQNYPNPFNPVTTIKFDIPALKGKTGLVKIDIFDLLGKKISSLVNENISSGSYSVNFDASRLATGTYVYRLSVNNEVIATKKMLLIK
ncbi:MAG: SBBP repeat-containing protein [Ignavibacteria bacterium]